MYKLNPTESSDQANRDLPGSCAREKLLLGGAGGLTERELLCLLLGRGQSGIPVERLASQTEEMIFGGLRQKAPPTVTELMTIKGMGLAKASAVTASLELGRRALQWRGQPLHRPEDALPHLAWMQDLDKEHFQALYLDSRRRLIRTETISVGTLDSSLVHPREVFRNAISCAASAVLVAHNHPSGDPEPSAEDLALTSRLDKAGRLLGIPLLDHLVVGRGDWVSLRQRQLQGESPVQMFAA